MIKLTIWLFILCCLISVAFQYYKRQAVTPQLVRIYDGDTFFVNIKGWPDVVGKNIGIRIKGVDTPEMHGKCAQEKALAENAKVALQVLLTDAKQITLLNIERGKYFRLVADVYADDKDVKQALIDARLGVPYLGKTKAHDWCLQPIQ